jgi:hypothetical protein
MNTFISIGLILFGGLISISSKAQVTKFVSPLDQDLNIKSVTVAPIPDNVSEIYSRPINQNINNLVEFDKQWTAKPWPADIKVTPEQLEENPKLVTQAIAKSGASAVLAARISKGPGGISMKMVLYSGKEGLPLVSENLNNYEGYETKDVSSQFENLFKSLKSRLPYSGEVLSRKGSLVTVNIGEHSGVRVGQELTAVQMLKIDRHPKFKFLVSSDVTIVGKIKIEKVDSYLSFGSVLSERELNAISPKTLIRREEFINYPRISSPLDPRSSGDINQRPESEAVLGKDPKSWKPEEAPTFGRLSFMGGIGTYNVSNNLAAGGGRSAENVSGRSMLTPSVHLLGEMWFDPRWFAAVDLRQYVARIDNGMSGSSPSTLNVSTLESNLQLGYNFLVQDSFWGPKFQLSGGFSNMSTYVDQSTPTAFNSMKFGGWTLGIAGSFPLDIPSKNPFTLGGKLLYYFYNTSVTESPSSSGGGKAQVSSFSATGEYRLRPRLGLRSELIFSLYGANFSGEGTRVPAANSASHQMTTLAFGVDYLF